MTATTEELAAEAKRAIADYRAQVRKRARKAVAQASREGVLADVGGKLREARAACGMRTRDLAEVLGVSQPAISSRELGTRDMGIEALLKHAAAVGLSPGDVLPGGQMEPGRVSVLAAADLLAGAAGELRKALRPAGKDITEGGKQ